MFSIKTIRKQNKSSLREPLESWTWNSKFKLEWFFIFFYFYEL